MSALRSVLAIGLMAALIGATPDVAPTPDPYAIFAQARHYWEHQRYPTQLAYTIAVTVNEAGTQKVEHYATYYNAVTNTVASDCVSDYERANPPSGKGIAFNFGIALPPAGKTWKIGHSGNPPIDFLGVPELAPNYSFGIASFVPGRDLTSQEIVAQIRAKFHDPARATPLPTSTPDPSGLKQIAVVSAQTRHYIISLVGIEQLEGAAAYHLKLQPVSQPKRYRLRDLWIDTQIYATRRLIDDGNFTDGPWPGAMWTVRFSQVDGATYIADETAVQGFDYRDLRYTGATEVAVQDVRPMDPKQMLPFCRPRAQDILSEPTV